MGLFDKFKKKEIDDKIIAELKEIEYFSNIGMSVTCINNFRCEHIPTIEQAAEEIESVKWENKRIEENGDITVFLCVNHKKIYNEQWNKKVAAVKTLIIPTVDSHIECLKIDGEMLKIFRNNIRYDIVGIAMALIFSEYIKSDFYLRLLQIYKNGHLPCGWKGKKERGCFLIH